MADKKCKECGRVTLYISWSSLKSWETCHQQAMLRRTGKRNKSLDQRVFFPGTVVDRIMRDWLTEDPENNQGRMVPMVSEIMEREEKTIIADGGKVKWKDSEDRQMVEKMCIEAVQKLEPHLNELVLPYEYQPAMRFKAPFQIPHTDGTMETVVLNGEFDLLTRNDEGKFSIWDLKITRDNNYWRKTLGQLLFYDLCVYLMFGEPSIQTGLIQPLATPELFPYQVTEDDRMQLLQRIVRMANGVWQGSDEPRNDAMMCGWCDVKHACSKFQPVISNDGKKRMSLFS